MSAACAVGLGRSYANPDGAPPNIKYPEWLYTNIRDANTPDRHRWVGFAMEAWQGGYRDRTEITHPDDPVWKSTAKRSADHARFLANSTEGKYRWRNSGGNVFEEAVKVVAAPITAPVHAIAKATSKIPVLSSLTGIVDTAASAPSKTAQAIASGERLDHVAIDAFKEQLKLAKDVAPYAQMVASLIPGLGTGVSMALGAGIALAEGQNITAMAKAAIRGAIPGGALAQAGFDLALKAASGENIGKAALETARAQLPATAQKAFDIGLAVVTGEKIQTALANGLVSIAPGQLQAVLAAGKQAIASTPGLADALKLVPAGEAAQGFHLAAGILAHAGINEKALIAARSQLPPAVRQGFDAALKTQEPHIAWLKNVPTSTPAASATETAWKQLAALTPEQQAMLQLAAMTPAQQQQLAALQKLSTMTPEQQKQLAALQSLSKLTPEQQRQLAAKAAPPAVKVAPVPTKPVAQAAVGRYAPYPKNMRTGVGDPPPSTSTEVRSPTSTSTEVRSPTSTSTEVRSPTSTSTEAYTQGNFTVTVTGGAGAGATNVDIHAPPLNRQNNAHSKGAPKSAHENVNVNAPRPKGPTAQENSSVNAPGVGSPPAYAPYGLGVPPPQSPHHPGHPNFHPARTFRGGRGGPGWWWDQPHSPEVITRTETCQTWGAPVDMPPAMQTAAKIALNLSKGQPTSVRGPDNTLYLFAIESGVTTARPCAAAVGTGLGYAPYP